MQRNFLVLYMEARFAMRGRNHVEELSWYTKSIYDIRKKFFEENNNTKTGSHHDVHSLHPYVLILRRAHVKVHGTGNDQK